MEPSCPFPTAVFPTITTIDLLFTAGRTRSLYDIPVQRIRAQSAANYFRSSRPNIHLGDFPYTRRMNNAGIPLSMEEITGKILEVAMDEAGSNFLKERMQEGKSYTYLIFLELKDHVCELMIDPIGSQVIHKMFEVFRQNTDLDMYSRLLVALTKDIRKFKAVCLHKHGSGMMMRLLETMNTLEQKYWITSVITPITLALTRTQNGNNVLQHCFEHFSIQINKDIFSNIASNFVDIAMDKNGCRILQKFLFYAPIEFIPNAFMLSKDPYGNYVVQYALTLKRLCLTENIVSQLSGQMFHLSMDKYGSNVVEKCLKECDKDQVGKIIHEISRNDQEFERVMTHQYGNFVVQSILEAAQGYYRRHVCKKIDAHYVSLHFSTHGRRVLQCAKKLNKLGAGWD